MVYKNRSRLTARFAHGVINFFRFFVGRLCQESISDEKLDFHGGHSVNRHSFG